MQSKSVGDAFKDAAKRALPVVAPKYQKSLVRALPGTERVRFEPEFLTLGIVEQLHALWYLFHDFVPFWQCCIELMMFRHRFGVLNAPIQQQVGDSDQGDSKPPRPVQSIDDQMDGVRNDALAVLRVPAFVRLLGLPAPNTGEPSVEYVLSFLATRFIPGVAVIEPCIRADMAEGRLPALPATAILNATAGITEADKPDAGEFIAFNDFIRCTLGEPAFADEFEKSSVHNLQQFGPAALENPGPMDEAIRAIARRRNCPIEDARAEFFLTLRENIARRAEQMRKGKAPKPIARVDADDKFSIDFKSGPARRTAESRIEREPLLDGRKDPRIASTDSVARNAPDSDSLTNPANAAQFNELSALRELALRMADELDPGVRAYIALELGDFESMPAAAKHFGTTVETIRGDRVQREGARIFGALRRRLGPP